MDRRAGNTSAPWTPAVLSAAVASIADRQGLCDRPSACRPVTEQRRALPRCNCRKCNCCILLQTLLLSVLCKQQCCCRRTLVKVCIALSSPNNKPGAATHKCLIERIGWARPIADYHLPWRSQQCAGPNSQLLLTQWSQEDHTMFWDTLRTQVHTMFTTDTAFLRLCSAVPSP